jgi:hypothetical protein
MIHYFNIRFNSSFLTFLHEAFSPIYCLIFKNGLCMNCRGNGGWRSVTIFWKRITGDLLASLI